VAEVTLQRLKKIPLSRFLGDTLLQELLPQVLTISLPEGGVLANPGQPECYLYYIESGQLDVEEVDPTGHEISHRQAKKGDYLGLYTLVTGRPCQVTATAKEASSLLAIPLREAHSHLVPDVEERRLARDQRAFERGQPADDLYFVLDGRVREVETDPDGKEIVHRYAGPGEYLGRYALLTSEPFRVSAVADEDAVLLKIPLRHLHPILFAHDNWRSWFFRTDIASRLRSVPLFIGLEDWDIYRLADAVNVEEYEENEIVYLAGEEADSFYIVDQGQVIEEGSYGGIGLDGDDWPKYFAAGSFFGHARLEDGESRRADATARRPTRLFCVSVRALTSLLAEGAPALMRRLKALDGELAPGRLQARLSRVSLFSRLSDENLRLLTGYVSLVYHRPGDFVARQGEPATSLLVLVEGEARVQLQVGRGQPRTVTYLKSHVPGPSAATRADPMEVVSFGEHALLADEMRGATVEVTKPGIWIVLSRKDFERFLDDADLKPERLRKDQARGDQASAAPPSQEGDLPLPYKVRRHWIIPLTGLLPLAVIMLAVVILLVVDVTSDLDSALRTTLLVGGLGFLLLVGAWAAYRYVDWWNDTYEITTRAVIHTERKFLLSEQRYEIPLPQIQNVNTLVGILGRILGFGDVGIDTAAARGQIRFTVIPNPDYVQELIQQASAQARSGLQVQLRESMRQQLEDQFYPERLKPSAPDSVLFELEETMTTPRASRLGLFRGLASWLPRFEIREDDRVIWRKHWINLLQRTGIQTLTMLLTIYLLLAYALAFVTDAFGLTPVQLPPVSLFGFQGGIFLVVGVLMIAAVLWFVYQYVDWQNDIYIVTDDEVIDVERKLAIFPFFFFHTESRKQASLSKVQYVDLQIPSPLAMILNYGDVIVQTAGAEGTLDFLFVSNPRRVHDEVLRRLGVYEERDREREFQERWGDMPQWFETYRDMLDQTGPQEDY
jgi:CRP-like cAMP-binding protein/uncharacterized membrane protein YdbT with pleckstrin-like domain